MQCLSIFQVQDCMLRSVKDEKTIAKQSNQSDLFSKKKT